MSEKLSQITDGGLISPVTDKMVVVRSGNTDVLATPGTAAPKAASDVTQTNVASVSGVIVAGHLAVFADTAGTIADGGGTGTAAGQAASSITGTVAAVNGGVTIGHMATFTDTAGTIHDGGAVPTLASLGAVPTSTTVNGHALSSNVVVSGSDITTGTVPVAQLPVATTSAAGVVQPDGTTITISGNVISAVGGSTSFVAGNGTATASTNAAALGASAAANDSGSVAVGNLAVSHTESIAIGKSSTAGVASGAGDGVAIGTSTQALGNNTVAIGTGADASASASIAIGNASTASAASSVALGNDAIAAFANSVAIGPNAAPANANGIQIRSSTRTLDIDGTTGLLTLPTNAGVLLKTSTTLTDASGAGAGTITNAPSAGNPTKWFEINDNGTILKIPAWI